MQAMNHRRRKDASYMVACCLAGILIAIVQFFGWRIPYGQINEHLVYQFLSSVAILSFGAACYKMGRLRSSEQKESTSETISFVPICSSCKQIRIGSRNNNGADNWESIEDYLYKNSNIRFSHTMCPDCADSYYQELEVYFSKEADVSNS